MPSSWPSRRMLTASMPSRSARSTAAASTLGRVSGRRRSSLSPLVWTLSNFPLDTLTSYGYLTPYGVVLTTYGPTERTIRTQGEEHDQHAARAGRRADV